MAPAAPPEVQMSPEELAVDRSGSLLAIFIVFTLLPTVIVSLRLVARWKTGAKLWWDDFLSIGALGLVWIQFAFLMEAIKYGLGKHVGAVNPADLKPYLMYTYLSELEYATAVSIVKISILCLYLRLFHIDRPIRLLSYVLIGFVTAWGVAVLLTTIFQCSPVVAAWDKSIIDSKCFILADFVIGSNVPNIVADVMIISLPVPRLWRLQLSTTRRVGMIALFFVAAIATVISIVRCILNARLNVMDSTYAFINVAIFSTVEVSVGLCCACMPVVYPLLRLLRGKDIMSGKGGYSAKGAGGAYKHSGSGPSGGGMGGSSSSRGRLKLESGDKDDDIDLLWTQHPGSGAASHDVHGGRDYKESRSFDQRSIPMSGIVVTRESTVQVDRSSRVPSGSRM